MLPWEDTGEVLLSSIPNLASAHPQCQWQLASRALWPLAFDLSASKSLLVSAARLCEFGCCLGAKHQTTVITSQTQDGRVCAFVHVCNLGQDCHSPGVTGCRRFRSGVILVPVQFQFHSMPVPVCADTWLKLRCNQDALKQRVAPCSDASWLTLLTGRTAFNFVAQDHAAYIAVRYSK